MIGPPASPPNSKNSILEKKNLDDITPLIDTLKDVKGHWAESANPSSGSRPPLMTVEEGLLTHTSREPMMYLCSHF